MPERQPQVPARSTEGQRTGQPALPSQARRPRGRPAGSKNKPKGLLPKDLASTILLELRDQLPPEHFEYMRSVIRDGKAISVERELDTMILLLGRNLYPALVMEGKGEQPAEDFFAEDGDEEQQKSESGLKMPVFRKDVTERLKVWSSLLAQKDKIERAKDDGNSGKSTILTIAAGRGIDPERLRILVGVEPGAVPRSVHEVGQSSDEARTVSDQVPERQELLPSGEQDEADRL